jgi:hypothetical protein
MTIIQRDNKKLGIIIVFCNILLYTDNYCVRPSVSPGIEPGYIVFPSHKKQCIYLVRRTATCMEHEKISSSAPGLA